MSFVHVTPDEEPLWAVAATIFGGLLLWKALGDVVVVEFGARGSTAFATGAALLVLAGQWSLWIRRLLRAGSGTELPTGIASLGFGACAMGLSFHVLLGEDFQLVFRVPALVCFAIGAMAIYECFVGGSAGAAIYTASRALGFTVSRPRAFRVPVASGWLEGVSVRLIPGEALAPIAEITGAMPRDLVVEREADPSMRRALFKETVVTGDEAFDSIAFLRGDEATTLACLPAASRRALSDALANGATISAGTLRSPVPHGHSVNAAEPARVIEARTRELVQLVTLLAVPADVAGALLRNVTEDIVPGARLRSLQCLVARYGGSEIAQRACVLALDDSDPRLRATAATWLVAHATGEAKEAGERVLDGVRAEGRVSIAEPATADGALSLAQKSGAVSLPKKT